LIKANDTNTHSPIDLAIHFGATTLIVAGHTGSGGVKLALKSPENDTVSEWIQPIRDVYAANKVGTLDRDYLTTGIMDYTAKVNRLVELNTIQQAKNVLENETVKKAGANVTVYAMVYDLGTGLLTNLPYTDWAWDLRQCGICILAVLN
jgi:carbonic anhydrase